MSLISLATSIGDVLTYSKQDIPRNLSRHGTGSSGQCTFALEAKKEFNKLLFVNES